MNPGENLFGTNAHAFPFHEELAPGSESVRTYPIHTAGLPSRYQETDLWLQSAIDGQYRLPEMPPFDRSESLLSTVPTQQPLHVASGQNQSAALMVWKDNLSST